MKGAQRPRFHHAPIGESSGKDAIRLGESYGVFLDPWQQLVLSDGLVEQADGRWATPEVCCVVARQNGKGEILLVRELAGLFLFGEQLIVHTAHEFKTAQEAFRRIWQIVDAHDDLRSRVVRKVGSTNELGFELKGGQRLRFLARSGSSGRGFTADCVVLDEAYDIPDYVSDALQPTLSARPNVQLWYMSSAVDQTSPAHANGVVLSRLRERGLAGEDPFLAYFEWSAQTDDGEKAVAAANPAYGYRITPEAVERERRGLSPRGFCVERLSIGDWPATDALQTDAFANSWPSRADRHAPRPANVVLGVDAAPDQTSAAICVAGKRFDGKVQVELAFHAARTTWVVDRLKELHAKYDASVVLVDPKSPAGTLVPALEQAGLPVRAVSFRELVDACGQFRTAVVEDLLRHGDDPPLNEAVAGARRREFSDGTWAWARKGTADISPLVAATLAYAGAVAPDEPSVYEDRGILVL